MSKGKRKRDKRRGRPSLVEAMKQARAKPDDTPPDVHERVDQQMPGMARTPPNDTPVPDMLPLAGERVIFVWGDPYRVGSKAVPMLFWITDVNPEGYVGGYAMPSPLLRAETPDGRPTAFPPLFPVVHVPYDPVNRRKLTWHTFEDAMAAPMPGVSVAETEEPEDAEPEDAEPQAPVLEVVPDAPATHDCCGLPADGPHAQVCPHGGGA